MNPRKHDFVVDVVAHEVVGDGFLRLHRTRLVNRRPGGSASEPYPCDFVSRPVGQNAVVVAVWRRANDGQVEVLLRRGLRPPLVLDTSPERISGTPLPAPLPMTRIWNLEVVAGILEAGEEGEAGIRSRANDELYEEAGVMVAAAALTRLGAASLSAPGLIAERLHFFAAEVTEKAPITPPPGDGSPMEEGASLEWMGLGAAIAACVAGTVEDCKTELALRRLKDWLDSDL